MNNMLKYTFYFALITFFQVNSAAQDWISFQSQGQVNDLVDTGDELFLATDVGLVVMNKTTLEKTIFDKNNADLSFNHVQTITKSASGDIWIGTYDGMLQRFDTIELKFKDKVFPEGDLNPNTFKLYDIEIAENGDFWFGTSEGAFRFQNNNWEQFAANEFGNPSADIWDIEILEDQSILFAENYIHELKNDSWTKISETVEHFNYLDAEIFVSSTGTIFFAGDLDKISSFDGSNWQIYPIDDFDSNLPGWQIIGFTEDTNGNIYLYTSNDGIYKLEGDNWVKVDNQQTEETEDSTAYFYIDEEGNEWLNTNIQLSVNTNGNIQNTSIANHTLDYNNIIDLKKDENGNIYFLTFSDANISVVDENGNWSYIALPADLSASNFINQLFVINEDQMYLSSNTGFYAFDGSTWIFNNIGYCTSFTKDADGKIYILGADNIFILENNSLTELSENSSFASETISVIGIDKENNLWLASYSESEIYQRLADGTWITYSKEEFPAIDQPNGSFHFTENGDVWITHDYFGAMKFDGQTWVNPFDVNNDGVFDFVGEVESYTAHSIESDADGKVYFSHFTGVTTFQNGEWENLLIPDVETNSSYFTKIVFNNKGTLWWGSAQYGVYAYETASFPTNFTEIIIDNKLDVYPNPAQNIVNIEFENLENSAVYINVFNKLGQLQLSENLGNFSVGKFQKTIELSDLPNGFYTLQVIANNKASTKKLIVQK